ncbi:MAG TPA: tetratricopeptide repeat protein [Caldithrix abyssi]|uniref:Tetratricopeptide repeat protein n=1 Tax=Caldithrix abyssi TaxID=187145 RepID=A0A7V1PUR2_CALAY|nr:tetratricopeptide repeat protein [Caldithrix abyssi]
MKRYVIHIVTITFFLSLGSCAYYNTFFNAEKYFESARSKKEAATGKETLPRDAKKNFQRAIEKSWKVINLYGDSSSWADDALFLIGKSHYELEEYDKAREIFEQFAQKYIQSEWLPASKVWLGKTYLMLGDKEKALERFSAILASDADDDLKAEAHLYLAHLYFESETYDKAIEHYTQVLELSGDEVLSTEALFSMAEANYLLGYYDKAIENYEDILKYDIPMSKRYDALARLIDALIEKKDYDSAIALMRNILTDQRYKSYFSLIEVKLANISEFQESKEFARSQYREVLRKYPRTEGAALAAFYLGQQFEYDLGQFDSAKTMYDRVRKEFPKAEAVEEAVQRGKLLAAYLKIHNQIKKDYEDLYKLEHGDSSLVDSMVTGMDTVEVASRPQPDLPLSSGELSANEERDVPNKTVEGLRPAEGEEANASQVATRSIKKIKEKKVAVSRTAEQVEKSLHRNLYNLGEFFLLSYERPDSALRPYRQFIERYPQDTVLTPKAYFSLYTAYQALSDSIDAEKVKKELYDLFPESIYSKKLQGRLTETKKTEKSPAHKKYLQAESLWENEHYDQAISLFREIARQDSGSNWALKSRYSVAWLYENILQDTDKAIEAYKLLLKEYPKSPTAKIAKAKITPPAAEKPVAQKTAADSSASKTGPKRRLDVLERKLTPKPGFEKDLELDEVAPKKDFIPQKEDRKLLDKKRGNKKDDKD